MQCNPIQANPQTEQLKRPRFNKQNLGQETKCSSRNTPFRKRACLVISVILLSRVVLRFWLLLIAIHDFQNYFILVDAIRKSSQWNPVEFRCGLVIRFQPWRKSPKRRVQKIITRNPTSRLSTISTRTPCGRPNPEGSACFLPSPSLSLSSLVTHQLLLTMHLHVCFVFVNLDHSTTSTAIAVTLESSSSNCIYNSRSSRVYTVVVVNRDEEVRAVVGKYRHAWIVGKLSEQEAVEKVVEIFVEVFVNGGKEEGSIHGEFMPVGADGSVVLSFNLLNADPLDWVYDWDFQELDDMLLAPIVQALRPIADISVESQVLYHTPKSSFSGWDEKQGSYIFSIKDLPFFVNSNEWHLDTSTAAGGRSKVLRFVVYVPSEEECPLQLLLPNGKLSTTNGFISPMWGGVVVWNPPSCSKNSEMQPLRHKISSEELKKVFEVFMGQLRQLFGLNSDSLYVGATATSRLLTSEKGFTQWELDFISRQHTCFNLLQCGTTLGSLSRLVQSLPRMIIMDEIGKQVKFSLDAAKSSLSNASIGNYDASAVSSRHARSLAEDAFYHPSMMSVSYYSFEHCFAVYSPFFLPVALHVILAVLREWKRCKQENKKYLAWKAKVN
nr:GPI transamidase component PIG-S [Ipomoea batatas]